MEDEPHGAARLSSDLEFALGFCPNTSAIALVSLAEKVARATCSTFPRTGGRARRTLRSAVVKIVFGEHVLDPDRRELTRGSEAIAVGPQVFDLLVHLVRNRERVVTKDDLIDVVWGGRIV